MNNITITTTKKKAMRGRNYECSLKRVQYEVCVSTIPSCCLNTCFQQCLQCVKMIQRRGGGG
jgi:hypothetical protein